MMEQVDLKIPLSIMRWTGLLPNWQNRYQSAVVSVEELKEAIRQTAIDFVIRLRSSSSVTISTCEQAVQVCYSYPITILMPCILFFQAADELQGA